MTVSNGEEVDPSTTPFLAMQAFIAATSQSWMHERLMRVSSGVSLRNRCSFRAGWGFLGGQSKDGDNGHFDIMQK
jgi:hypothetical protein